MTTTAVRGAGRGRALTQTAAWAGIAGLLLGLACTSSAQNKANNKKPIPKKPLPKLGEPSRDGFYALLADGSVRYVPKNTDERILRAMITRAGNEAFEMPGQAQ